MAKFPRIAIVANGVTPYRLHLHERIARELAGVELWSCFTHDTSNASWKLRIPRSIRPVHFGPQEQSADQDKLLNQRTEWQKGGRLLQWLDSHEIRAVVIDGYNDLGRLRVILGCRRRGVPCFLFGDSNIACDRPAGWKAVIKKRYVRWVLGHCAGALHCGRLGREYFHRYGMPLAKLFPFPYEPDYDLLSRVSAQDAESFRRRTSLLAGRKRLLYCGRLVRQKRVDLVILAFLEIAKERPDWDLVVAGDGPECDNLRALIPPELSSRVHWLGFINEPADLGCLYRVCDVLVHPSDYEPWGIVVAEAATGMALLCSSVVGAAADLVEHGRNGLIVSPGDLGELALALREVTLPGVYERMQEQSPIVLNEWRGKNDPVDGLRRALQSVQVLPSLGKTAEGGRVCTGQGV